MTKLLKAWAYLRDFPKNFRDLTLPGDKRWRERWS